MNALSQLLMDDRISGRAPIAFKVPENVTRTSQTESAARPVNTSLISIDGYLGKTADNGPSLRRAG